MPQLVLLFKGLFSAFPTLWPLPQQGVVGGWGYVETSGAYAGSRQRSKWSSVSCLCRWPRLVFLTPPDSASGASPLCPTQLITAAHLCHPCLVVGLCCGAGGTGKDSQHTSVGELWWSGCCQRSGPSLVHCLICANPACLHPLMFFFSQVTSVSMGTYSSWSWLSHIQFCSVIWHSSAQTRLECSLDLGHGKPNIQSSRSLCLARGQASIAVFLLSSRLQVSFSLSINPWGLPGSKVGLSALHRASGLGCPGYGSYHSLPKAGVCPCLLPFLLGPLLGSRSQPDCLSSLPTWLITCVSFL